MPRPWLAGVCAWSAWKLDWHVLGLRAVVFLALLLAPVATAVCYLCCALVLGMRVEEETTKPAPSSEDSPLGERIEKMEQRLADFDREMARRG
jgi:phage shock protein PspC (stress-responsive transcriptional regulator)